MRATDRKNIATNLFVMLIDPNAKRVATRTKTLQLISNYTANGYG